MTVAAGAPRSAVERVFALVVAALALGHGCVALATWAAPGTVPGARDLLDIWPLAFGVVLAVLAVASVLRRADAPEVALAALAWAFGVEACRDLPPFPAAQTAGDGLALVPWHVLIALGAGLYALTSRRGQGAANRSCALLVLWTTGNLKMFTRDREAVYALFAAAVLLVFTVHGRRLGPRALFAGPGRAAAGIGAVFVAWWVLAAVAADSPRLGIDLVLRVATGALFAWTLAGALDGEGVRRCVTALLVGLALSLGMLVSAVLEMRGYVGWDRIFAWRLRLFGLHANQIGPLFAWGVCLAVPLWLARPRRPVLEQILLGMLALGCLGALVWTSSRASLGGLVLGLPLALLATRGRLPHRPGRWLLGGAATAALLVALLATPVGDSLVERLDQRAQAPSAIGQRWHFWKMAAAAVREHPLLGLGPNHYYAHTRYAEPSYYDGTIQALHPHNALLAAGESAGVPGMLLFAALCLAALEALRRGLLAAPSDDRRRRLAGLLGALVALLASNVLDLGQSQNTFVPLLLWIALGIAGAECGLASAGGRPLRAGVAGAFAALVLVPAALLPLAGRALIDRARAARFEGETARASELYSLALRLQPWNEDALRALIGSYREQGRRAELLSALRAETEAAPSRSASWFELARELLEQGFPEQALVALGRAAELDPRGPRQGDVAFSMAWAELLLGDVEAAREHLYDGMRKTGGAWRRLPRRTVPARPEDPPDARPIGFVVRGGGMLRFDDLLEDLGQETLALSAENHKDARRLLMRVAADYRELSLPERAHSLIEEYMLLRPDAMGSVQGEWLELLGELERWDELTAAYDASPYRGDPHITTSYLRALLEGEQEARIDLERDWTLALDAGKAKDLFFTAGENAGVLDVAARLALLREDEEGAFRALRAGIYDREGPGARVIAVQVFLHRLVEYGSSDEALARALRLLLREASLAVATARDPKRHREWAQSIKRGWSGSPAELRAAAREAASGTGAAGDTFLNALERVLRGS